MDFTHPPEVRPLGRKVSPSLEKQPYNEHVGFDCVTKCVILVFILFEIFKQTECMLVLFYVVKVGQGAIIVIIVVLLIVSAKSSSVISFHCY